MYEELDVISMKIGLVRSQKSKVNDLFNKTSHDTKSFTEMTKYTFLNCTNHIENVSPPFTHTHACTHAHTRTHEHTHQATLPQPHTHTHTHTHC